MLWENSRRFVSNRLRDKWLVLTLSVAIVLIIGWGDYLTSDEISLSLFYVLPVALVSWHLGRRPGLLISILSASVALLGELCEKHPHYSSFAIPIWNFVLRVGFFIIVSALMASVRMLLEKTQMMALEDPLTGVANSRAFLASARTEWSRAQRYGRPLSLVYLDLDNFKQVNDSQGHTTGNEVLRRLAQTFKAYTRRTDVVARLGGDEFAILLPDTSAAQAREVLEKIRAEISDLTIEGLDWQLTISIGMVTFSAVPDSVDEMIQLADALMYSVKRNGKNKIAHEVYGARKGAPGLGVVSPLRRGETDAKSDERSGQGPHLWS